MRTSLESTKDYISIDDVVNILPQIATQGRHRVYNLASGRNISNRKIMQQLMSLTDCQVEVAPNAQTVVFPEIDISRITEEFGFAPSDLLGNLGKIVHAYRVHKSGDN